MELIENAVGAGHKVLLFSQFTSMLERLAAGLKKAGIDYYMLTGSVGKEKRMQMVESFNEDDVPVFCISLKAGGNGLNLTAADIVIHYDPWWNVAVQNQATDRAHRIGQKHVVTVYKLVSEGTIEEKIIAIQERKKETRCSRGREWTLFPLPRRKFSNFWDKKVVFSTNQLTKNVGCYIVRKQHY